MTPQSQISSRLSNRYLLLNNFSKQAENDYNENITPSDNNEGLETEVSSFPSSRNQNRTLKSAQRVTFLSEKKEERVQTANPKLSTKLQEL